MTLPDKMPRNPFDLYLDSFQRKSLSFMPGPFGPLFLPAIYVSDMDPVNKPELLTFNAIDTLIIDSQPPVPDELVPFSKEEILRGVSDAIERARYEVSFSGVFVYSALPPKNIVTEEMDFSVPSRKAEDLLHSLYLTCLSTSVVNLNEGLAIGEQVTGLDLPPENSLFALSYLWNHEALPAWTSFNIRYMDESRDVTYTVQKTVRDFQKNLEVSLLQYLSRRDFVPEVVQKEADKIIEGPYSLDANAMFYNHIQNRDPGFGSLGL